MSLADQLDDDPSGPGTGVCTVRRAVVTMESPERAPREPGTSF